MSLNIYSQECWHDNAYIVGTRDSIKELIKVLACAFRNTSEDGTAQADFFCSDGEGYTVHVVIASKETMDTKAPVPYTEEYARESRTTVVHPSRLNSDD
jgi:hypothetical protein